MSKATWRKELFNRLASSPKPRTQVPYVGRVSPKSNTRKSPKPYGRRSQREIIAKGSIELIRIVAFSIISSLNNLGIHLSDHYIIYIVSISKLVYLYIMYCVKYTVNYSKTEISIIIKEFIETVSNLLELPRKNLQNNSQDIQRCVTNVATENIISKFGSYIGYSGGENIETKQLSNLKTQLESTNVKISSELYKLKNDIEFNYINEIFLTFSVIDKEIRNFPETINKYINKLIKNEIKEIEETTEDVKQKNLISYKSREDMLLNRQITSIIIQENPVIYTPNLSIIKYKEPENIEKISNALEIPYVNLESLINMIEIESNIPFDDENIFDDKSVCGRTSRRMFTNFKTATNTKIQEIYTLVHDKIEEEQYFLKENYEHIQFITAITLIIVLSLLINKGIRTMVKSCCRRADGKRSSRKRKSKQTKKLSKKRSKKLSKKRSKKRSKSIRKMKK
jgi:hypothetical protein